MTVRLTITLPEKLHAQVGEFARQAEVNYSAAVRTLLGRALGSDLGRLLANEKVLEVRRMVDAKVRAQTEVFIQNIQADLDGTFAEPEEVEPEPNLTGRRPARARRR